MDMTAAEGRVLGCLVEAQVANPDVYAVTLDELRFSCNQITGREPVMLLDDRVVEDTLLMLKSRGLARFVTAGHRAGPISYRHRADERWRLGEPELAVLAVLLVRGPQTVDQVYRLLDEKQLAGSRTEVEAALDTLAGRTPRSLATRLAPSGPGPAQPGDVMWAEVLTGPPQVETLFPVPPRSPVAVQPGNAPRLSPTLAEVADRLTNIERRLAGIEAALQSLRGATAPPAPRTAGPSRIHR
ncbi:MAG TPA: DUF480 domain-containing protein [Acidimicrobiales bacterium]|nr:DUF480 domain-containing protein [Acidimicrobiales bacterium]